MAIIKIKSGASGTGDGVLWADAKVDATAAASADAAGDTFLFSPSHAESTSSTITLNLAGTPAAPTKLICAGSDATESPTSCATTATITSNSTVTLVGSCNAYGLKIRAGNTAGLAQGIGLGGGTNQTQVFRDCSLEVLTTGTGQALIELGGETRSDVQSTRLYNTNMRLSGVNNRVKLAGFIRWEGGSFIAGSANLVNVFIAGLRLNDAVISNVNLSSNIGTAFNLLMASSSTNACIIRFNKITFPNNWTGSLWSATPAAPNIRAELYNSFAGTTKIRLWAWDFAGQVRDNTVVYRTGGASDDAVPFSVRMASTADAEYPTIPLEGTSFSEYVNTTSAQTWTFEIVHDSQGAGAGSALQNHEFGLRVTYPGGTVETVKADQLATSSDLASSTASWVTTGMTSPVTQKITVNFTPTSKGDVSITPILLTASKTVYICPLRS